MNQNLQLIQIAFELKISCLSTNNVRFESYASDLKLIFGQSDLGSGKELIEQHTAITMSWAQVKLAIYAQANLIMYKTQTGVPVQGHLF